MSFAQCRVATGGIALRIHLRGNLASTNDCQEWRDAMSVAEPSVSGLIHQRPFVLFWLARLAATMGYQMLALTIGWKIYEITGSAFDLGLVGLIQFIPA